MEGFSETVTYFILGKAEKEAGGATASPIIFWRGNTPLKNNHSLDAVYIYIIV